MTRYIIAASRHLAATPEEVWRLTTDTSRYADWVGDVREVIAHHGPAHPGGTYTEMVALGPITAQVVWTVRKLQPMSLQMDSAEGLAPLRDVVNVFRFVPIGDGSATTMTYEFQFGVRPGIVGALVHRALSRPLAAGFQSSMRTLECVIASERCDAAQ